MPLEIVTVGIGKSRPFDDASVVDQDVEVPELLDGCIDERLCTALRGHVTGVGDGNSASGDDLRRDGGRHFGISAPTSH